jgi:adenylate cyclase
VPLVPVLELMRRTLGVGDSDEPALARERIATRLEELDASFATDLPLLFDFLGVPDPDRPAPTLDPDARQRRLFAIVRRLVRARSAVEPAVLVVEDLHWLDDASGQFLAELVRAVAGTRTLLLLTYRPEYRAELLHGSHCEQLALRPLANAAVQQLLRSLLGQDQSLDGLSEMIAARAVGNPFFCEELVAALAETEHLVGARGAYRLGRTLDGIVLPATVQATLAARIDRLGEREKELLQLAAVIGYDVSEPLLRAISGLGDADLEDALQSLVSAELLSARIGPAGVEYAFKHPLTQEVAYRSQLAERRREVHHQVAAAIEALYPDGLQERAALIAQHCEAAGEMLAAARWNARAARWVGRSDMTQAATHWRKVAQLSESLPDSHDAKALSRVAHVRQLDYGWRLGMTQEEAAAHYRRAREIIEEAGDRETLVGLTALYANARGLAGHLEDYRDLSEEAARLSAELADADLRMTTLVVVTYSRLCRGELLDALAAADEAVALGRNEPSLGSHTSSLVSPYAYMLMLRGAILCYLGRLDEASATLEVALTVAGERGDLETQGWAHMYSVLVARYSGEIDKALQHGRRAYEIAELVGSAFSRVWQLYFFGYARLLAGEAAEAVEAIERAIDLARHAGTGLELEPVRWAALAEALLAAGEPARALAAAQEAVRLAEDRGNRGTLPYCYRVRAEGLLANAAASNVATAQEALQAATEAASATGAVVELPLIESVRAKLRPSMTSGAP